MSDPVAWFDLGAADDQPLTAFYRDVFGWTPKRTSETYTVLSTGGGMQGGVGRSRTGDPWLAFYVLVDDLEATLDRIESLGGKTAVPVTEVPNLVQFAMFTDPDGLLIGLFKPIGEPAEGQQPSSGVPVDWFEVMGSDTTRSQAFYGELFGWTFEDAGGGYVLVDTGAGSGVPGGIGASDQGVTWATVYANVDDVERYLARAEELGGTRVYGPVDVDDHMQAGAIRDPAGNLFGVYHHEPH